MFLLAVTQARERSVLPTMTAANVKIVRGCQSVTTSFVDDNLKIRERPERHSSQRTEGLQTGRFGDIGEIVDNEAVGRIQESSCLNINGTTTEQDTMKAGRVGHAPIRHVVGLLSPQIEFVR
jgi:hypothetical protein